MFTIIGCTVKISLLRNRFVQKWHHLQIVSPIGLEVSMVYNGVLSKNICGEIIQKIF